MKTKSKTPYDEFREVVIRNCLESGFPMLVNPFKSIRETGRFQLAHGSTGRIVEVQPDQLRAEFAKKSMQAIADDMKMSKHGYLRAEQGFYSEPERVIDYYAEQYGFSYPDLLNAYNNWKTNVRQQHRRCFGSLRTTDREHPLVTMQRSLKVPDHPPVGELSLTELCKIMCVSQSTVSRWLKSVVHQKTVPSEILGALREMGYTTRELLSLEDNYYKYRKGVLNDRRT